MFQEILDLMENGNWNDAQREFKAINPTAREYYGRPAVSLQEVANMIIGLKLHSHIDI